MNRLCLLLTAAALVLLPGLALAQRGAKIGSSGC
jgi:hypothetical protein